MEDEEIRRRIEERKAGEVVESVASGGIGKKGKGRRGYRVLYERSVNQAEEGADFDFLTAKGVD